MTTTQANQLKYIYDNISTNVKITSMAKMVLLGTGTSFNISDIVGVENVDQYSINDFIVVPDIQDVISGSFHTVNPSNTYTFKGLLHKQRINKTPPILVYDNSTGNVTVTNEKVTTVSMFYVNANLNYYNITNTFEIPSKVYLCCKTGFEV